MHRHVLTARDPASIPSLAAIGADYVKPLLEQEVFGGRAVRLGEPKLSRNHHLPGETERRRSMLWHWDGLAPTTVKVILPSCPRSFPASARSLRALHAAPAPTSVSLPWLQL